MQFARKHWYDAGGFLAVVVTAFVLLHRRDVTHYQLVMWASLVALFLHQLEEYRIVGTFPGTINTVMYHSQQPDRFPLNTNTAFIINVGIGWTLYFFAAFLAEKAVWLGIATMLVSVANTIAHAILFNLKAKSLYNAGMLTGCLLFVPCTCFFFFVIHTKHLVTPTDYVVGIPLGIFINIVGVLKMIDWMSDKKTPYIFEKRNLLPMDRENHPAT